MMDPGSTHWETCWRDPDHHACTLRLVQEPEEKAEDLHQRLVRYEMALISAGWNSGGDQTLEEWLNERGP